MKYRERAINLIKKINKVCPTDYFDCNEDPIFINNKPKMVEKIQEGKQIVMLDDEWLIVRGFLMDFFKIKKEEVK